MVIKLRRHPKREQEELDPNGHVTAAGMYKVRSSYVRFNQKNNLGSQKSWNPAVASERAKLKAKQHQLMEKGHRGYDLPSWSLDSAADSFLSLLDFSKSVADQGATSWQSRLGPRPGSRWQASAREASRVVRKAAKLFGADQAGVARLDRRWVYSYYFDEQTMEDYPIKFSDERGYEQYDEPARLEDGTRVIPKEMQYVVVMLHEWPGGEKGTEYAPTLLTEGLSTLAYTKMAPAVWQLAEFIRGSGTTPSPAVTIRR